MTGLMDKGLLLRQVKNYFGYFKNGQYVPNLCQAMGLVKGTESFGSCVLKLIDDL